MDIGVYLPDELGKRAKDAGLPLSRLLRREVEKELGLPPSVDWRGNLIRHKAKQSRYVQVWQGKEYQS